MSDTEIKPEPLPSQDVMSTAMSIATALTTMEQSISSLTSQVNQLQAQLDKVVLVQSSTAPPSNTPVAREIKW